MKKYMKTCMFLCFHVNYKHESTKTCMLISMSFIVYTCTCTFTPHCIMVKGLLLPLNLIEKTVIQNLSPLNFLTTTRRKLYKYM